MKKYFVFLLLNFFVVENLFAQKEDRNWVFGDFSGINFNNLSLPILYSVPFHNYEPSASVSDKNGNLLLYTGYETTLNVIYSIYDKNNIVIENGDSINIGQSSTNGVLFIPDPNDSAGYFLFSQKEYYNLFYSKIVFNQSDSLFHVTDKNIFLNDSMTEKISAVKHGNGRDWWIITHKQYSNTFTKYLLSTDGIHGPFYQNIGSIHSGNLNFYGEIAASKFGNKIGCVTGEGIIDVFDFDRCSGILSDWKELGDTSDPINENCYGCEFSPDESKFYVSMIDDYPPFKTTLEQFSLNSDNVANSKNILYHEDPSSFFLDNFNWRLTIKFISRLG